MQEDLTSATASAAAYYHHQSMIMTTAKQQQRELPEQEQLNCPRCDSPNTKFCYYNNYNLSQPRHFCKNCRRYWTKGGSLRNIPVGGGSRKNNIKRSSSSSSSPSSSSSKSRTVAVSDQERTTTGNSGQEMDPTRMLYGLPVGDPVSGSFGSLLASNMQQIRGVNYETGSGWYPGMELGLGSGFRRSDDAALTDISMNRVEKN